MLLVRVSARGRTLKCGLERSAVLAGLGPAVPTAGVRHPSSRDRRPLWIKPEVGVRVDERKGCSPFGPVSLSPGSSGHPLPYGRGSVPERRRESARADSLGQSSGKVRRRLLAVGGDEFLKGGK